MVRSTECRYGVRKSGPKVKSGPRKGMYFCYRSPNKRSRSRSPVNGAIRSPVKTNDDAIRARSKSPCRRKYGTESECSFDPSCTWMGKRGCILKSKQKPYHSPPPRAQSPQAPLHRSPQKARPIPQSPFVNEPPLFSKPVIEPIPNIPSQRGASPPRERSPFVSKSSFSHKQMSEPISVVQPTQNKRTVKSTPVMNVGDAHLKKVHFSDQSQQTHCKEQIATLNKIMVDFIKQIKGLDFSSSRESKNSQKIIQYANTLTTDKFIMETAPACSESDFLKDKFLESNVNKIKSLIPRLELWAYRFLLREILEETQDLFDVFGEEDAENEKNWRRYVNGLTNPTYVKNMLNKVKNVVAKEEINEIREMANNLQTIIHQNNLFHQSTSTAKKVKKNKTKKIKQLRCYCGGDVFIACPDCLVPLCGKHTETYCENHNPLLANF